MVELEWLGSAVPLDDWQQYRQTLISQEQSPAHPQLRRRISLPSLCLAFANCSSSLINKDLRDVLSHSIDRLSLFSPLLETKNFSTDFWKYLLLCPLFLRDSYYYHSAVSFLTHLCVTSFTLCPCCLRCSGLGWDIRCARHGTGHEGLFWTGLGKQVKTENDRETGCMTVGLYRSSFPSWSFSAATEAFSRRQNWSCLHRPVRCLRNKSRHSLVSRTSL